RPLGLAPEPLEQEHVGLRLRSDDGAAQVVQVRLRSLAQALRLPVHVQRIVEIRLYVRSTSAGVNTVGRDLQDPRPSLARTLRKAARKQRVDANRAIDLHWNVVVRVWLRDSDRVDDPRRPGNDRGE